VQAGLIVIVSGQTHTEVLELDHKRTSWSGEGMIVPSDWKKNDNVVHEDHPTSKTARRMESPVNNKDMEASISPQARETLAEMLSCIQGCSHWLISGQNSSLALVTHSLLSQD